MGNSGFVCNVDCEQRQKQQQHATISSSSYCTQEGTSRVLPSMPRSLPEEPCQPWCIVTSSWGWTASTSGKTLCWQLKVHSGWWGTPWEKTNRFFSRRSSSLVNRLVDDQAFCVVFIHPTPAMSGLTCGCVGISAIKLLLTISWAPNKICTHGSAWSEFAIIIASVAGYQHNRKRSRGQYVNFTYYSRVTFLFCN